MQSLRTSIERLAAQGEVEHNPEARPAFLEFRDALRARSALPKRSTDDGL